MIYLLKCIWCDCYWDNYSVISKISWPPSLSPAPIIILARTYMLHLRFSSSIQVLLSSNAELSISIKQHCSYPKINIGHWTPTFYSISSTILQLGTCLYFISLIQFALAVHGGKACTSHGNSHSSLVRRNLCTTCLV